jgi:hypothetical protein
MAVDFYGRTVYNPADTTTAIERRLGTVDAIGNQQNQFAQAQADRVAQAKAAANDLALQQAQTASVNVGTQNMQKMQNSAGSSASAGSVKAGNSFESFKNAIGMQESGGNYKAINKGSGALGKYQVMPNNLAGTKTGWDYAALGYDVTPAQFIGSASIQEKVADKFLQGYYNKYGPAGAAVAWYAGPTAAANYAASGHASTSAQKGGPPVSGYIQDILVKMGLA